MPDRIRQQDTTTFTQAARAAQQGPRTVRRTAGRPRKSVYVSGVRYAQSSIPHDSTGTPRVIATFSRAGGPAGLAGREAVVIIGHAELGTLLGAVPASVIPADLRTCYVDVIRWLKKGPLA